MSVKLLQKMKFRIVGFLGSLLVRVLIFTLRVRTVGESHLPHSAGKGAICCFWHAQLLALVYLYRNRNIHVLVSRHRDGEYIVRVTDRLGFGAVRGSSTRGGVRLLGEALEKLSQGIDIAVTPDGPRGPRQQFKPGALFLARKSGAPLVLGACVPEKAWRLKSWDQFYIPKPFSRAVLVVGEQIYISNKLTGDEMEAKRLELQDLLNELTRQAEEMAKSKS
jgi:lysophospholipid acyltransferase (LPLAT)-like uncharacterized protein